MAPKSISSGLSGTPAVLATEFPWRVLGLINVFRLMAPMVLLLVFFFDTPTRSIGTQYLSLIHI